MNGFIVTPGRRAFTTDDAVTYSMIRRGHTEPEFYTVMSNDWVRDARLSWKAKGLMLGVLSHVDGFDGFSLDWLVRHGTERIDAVRSGVRELEALGYLRRTERREAGRLLTDWATSDPTGSDNPTRREPVDNSPHWISRGGSAEAVNPRRKQTTERTPRENTTSTLNAAGAAKRGRAWRAGDEVAEGTVHRLSAAMLACGFGGNVTAEVVYLRTLSNWPAVAERVRRWCGVQAAVKNGSVFDASNRLVALMDESGQRYVHDADAWADLIAGSSPSSWQACSILDSGYCDSHGVRDCEHARV